MKTTLEAMARAKASRYWVRAGCLLVLGLCAGSAASLAQSDWEPFRDRDQRTQRVRPRAEPLPPVDNGVLQPNRPADDDLFPGRPSAPGQSGIYQSGPIGATTVERIELAPLDPQLTAPVEPRSPAVAAPAIPPPVAPPSPSVASRQAPPQVAAPVTELGTDLWRGVDMRQLEELIAPIALPPRSIALHGLWSRLFTTASTPPAGGKGPSHYFALQLEALYRTGLIEAMKDKLATVPTGDAADPLITAFRIRHALVNGDRASVCELTKTLAAKRQALPKLLLGEVHLLNGYCAAADGNAAAAGLAAELAREEQVEAPLALAVLDAFASGQKQPALELPARLLVLDFRLMQLLGPVDPVQILGKAEPALLVALATGENSDPRLTVLSAEAAAGINALAPAKLLEVYALIDIPAAQANDPIFRQAQLFKAITKEANPLRRLPLMRQLLDTARRTGLYTHMARALAKPLADVPATAEATSHAEVAIEIALASGDYPRARQFALLNPSLRHWLGLIDTVDPSPRRAGDLDQALGFVEELARRGRIPNDVMHRMATVLDALDINVPLPLWEAAGRTPQPNTGHLPETGVLPQLQDAAKKREMGRTILLTMRTLGPQGTDGAHLIALGDSIRALRRIGLDADARQVALEALFGAWPRTLSN